ncbi:MAG TPA: hypothetical protein VGS79_20460 [Puia sp.]|nr:hypothetical protein [Puia sp.]
MLLSIHILAALTCVIAGIMAMFAQKRPGLHPLSGTVYYWSLWIVFGTVVIISIPKWSEDYHLFILGCFAICSAVIGRAAEKYKWGKWPIVHITCMSTSYIILLTAFYVDNGKFLPIWKNFNPLAYWLLPAAVGIPILLRTLRRHPLSKKYFDKI